MAVVKSRLLSEESVPGVISTLKTLYGRPDLIINTMLTNIREEPAPKADNLNTLVDFAMKVGNRFRQNRFAIVGDIKEMFHQVKIRDEDKHAQRFLWRNGDQSKAPDQYVMNVMTFGATCSPSAAQYVKNLNAAEFEEKYPRAVEGIVKNHYVDDWLDGQEDEAKLSNLINEVIEIHAHGGFEIRNFLSNSIDIKARFSEPSVESKQVNLEIVSGNERVLGMWWDTYNDEFTYSMKYFRIDEDIINYARSPTKREVLRILMSVFDPLGFLSHYLVHLKILLQQVWRSKLDWDEELNTAEMKQAWRNWFELLPKVEEIGIPRLISTKISPNVARSIELHVFVDANEQAFSAVAYLRVEDENGVDCALLGSKARVAPLKYLSVPRMELQAGVLGTRLLTSICEGQTIYIDRKQIWTDSTTVLSWIRSDNRKYHQFVANRIGEISENTTLQEWRWIPSKENVADEATKWENPPTFTQSSRWFSGPSFLKLPSNQWPKDKWKENQRLADLFWTKFVKEFLPELTRTTKWIEPAEPIKVGDIVLIIDETNRRNSYPKARVIDAVMGSNGQVRRVRVQRSDKSALWRSAHGVAKLDVQKSVLDAPPEDIKTRGSVKNVNTDLDEAASAKWHRTSAMTSKR